MEALRKVVEIDKNQTNKKPNELTDFQKLLLSAPVMTDEEYNFFLNKKQNFKNWKFRIGNEIIYPYSDKTILC